MGQDKALLQYHGKAQLAYAVDLLAGYCEKVFVSNRQDQAEDYALFPQIHDRYAQVGPLSGILSAMEAFPGVAWCVLANDMPHVDEAVIGALIRQRHPEKEAVAYANPQQAFPEPLCAIYEARIQSRLVKAFSSGCYSLRRILQQADIQLLPSPTEISLLNVNTLQEYTSSLRSCLKSPDGGKSDVSEMGIAPTNKTDGYT